jgi:hypothetical protein
MGITNISGCGDQTGVISDNGGMIWDHETYRDLLKFGKETAQLKA